MGIIDNDLNKTKKQFISVAELLEFIANIDNCSAEESAAWLYDNQHILRKTKSLFLESEYSARDYKKDPPSSSFIRCPIETIMLLSTGEDCSLWSDSVGFARKRLLIDLKEVGFNIDDELIRNTPVYISKNCFDDDDNFYKNQCIDLSKETQQALIKKPTRTQEEMPYVHFLDKESPRYFPLLALVARLHNDMNYIGRYSDISVKVDRVKTMLEEYGSEYGYTATETHAKNLAQIIPNRKEAQAKTEEILKKVLLPE